VALQWRALKGNTTLQRALAEKMSSWAASQEEVELIRGSEDRYYCRGCGTTQLLLGQDDDVEGTQASFIRRR